MIPPVRTWSASALAACALAACTQPAAAPPPPAAPPPAAPPPEAHAFAGTWGAFRSERFELELGLPDGHAWRIDDHKSPWLSATHAATESLVVARAWREDGRATRERCEEQARLWRALPDPTKADAVQARSINAPADFDTFVSIGVVPGKPGDTMMAGFAVAFGGHGHRCFAWAYTTTVRGAGAESILAERLATMVERSLGRVVLGSELSPHVPRERVLPDPR